MGGFLISGALGTVPHGFSTSEGLNLSDVVPGAQLVRPVQVHSADVLAVTQLWEDAPEADALVTRRPGLALGIVTADCAPVLLADPHAGVVGAAHAGWRGALGGVLENTVAAMVSLGASPNAIRAAIGPTIAQGSYEVDEAFREQFDDGDCHFFEFGREGHRQFDLPAYVAHRLGLAGVGTIDDLAEDTYSQPGRFFSYRRATHLNEPTNGRQLSVIGLPA